jgi:hypothetical protein
MPPAKTATISKSRQPPRFLVHEPWPKATLRAPYVQILRNRPRCFRGHHGAKMTNRESRARDSLMTSRFWRANASCLGYPQLRLPPRGLFGIGPSLAESARLKIMVDKTDTAIPRQSNRRRKKQPETGSTNGSGASVPSASERPASGEPRENIQLLPEPRAVLAPDIKNLGDDIRAFVSPLEDMLEREIAERRALQIQADQLLAKLAATQVELAEAMGTIGIGQAKLEAAESRAAEAISKVEAAEAKVEAAHSKGIDLQRRIDALRLELADPPKRRWWLF